MIKEQRAQVFFPVARRLSAALLSLSVCVGSLFSFPAYATGTVGPLGDKVESGYDADTWARLQDNVLEYDEIPNLVHEYNSVVSGIWDDLEETRRTLEANAQELIDSLTAVDGDKIGLYMIDKELAARTYVVPTPLAGKE